MFQRRTRRFKGRSNGRNHMLRGNGRSQERLRTNSFVNDQMRSKFGTHHSAEKLFEKYTSLAKEAVSSGDISLSENYLQHADHFMRVIEDKNKNRDQSKTNIIDKSVVDNKRPSENSGIRQEDVTKNKE